MKRFFILFFVSMSFSDLALSAHGANGSSAKSSSQAARRSPAPMVKSNEVLLSGLSKISSNAITLNVLRKHVAHSEYLFLKTKAQQSGVRFKEKNKLTLVGNSSFHFGDTSQVFKFDKSGASVSLGKNKFAVDKKKSVRENFKLVQSQLNNSKTVSHWSWMIPEAHALDKNTDLAYHLTVLMYYMEVYNMGNGEIMWDMFLAEPKVQAAYAELHRQGVRIKDISCDEIGMVFTFENGTKSYATFSDTMLLTTKTEGGNEEAVSTDETDATMGAQGRMYYCQMMWRDLKTKFINDINQNIIQPNTMGEDYDSNGTIEQ